MQRFREAAVGRAATACVLNGVLQVDTTFSRDLVAAEVSVSCCNMKGVICNGAGGPEVLKLSDVPEPNLQAGEVLIAVKATALNGADVMQRQGNYPPPPGTRGVFGLIPCNRTMLSCFKGQQRRQLLAWTCHEHSASVRSMPFWHVWHTSMGICHL